MIAAESIVKSLGGKRVLDGVSLSIESGVVALIGRNGAGKSTLLRILCGLWKPEGGRVTIGGHDMEGDPVAAKKLLGYQPEHPDLHPSMRPRELFRLVAAARNLPQSAIDAATARVEIEDIIDKPCGSLSYGQRRMVTLVAATMHDPPVLLLDEPTNALDPHRVAALKEYLREGARTALIATHQLDFISTIASRFILMKDGRIVADGSVASIGSALQMPGASLEAIVLQLT